jgi:hypothetical protein
MIVGRSDMSKEKEVRARSLSSCIRSHRLSLAGVGLFYWISNHLLPYFTSGSPIKISESLFFAIFLLFFSLIGGSFLGLINWMWHDSQIKEPVRNQ